MLSFGYDSGTMTSAQGSCAPWSEDPKKGPPKRSLSIYVRDDLTYRLSLNIEEFAITTDEEMSVVDNFL